MILNLTSLTDYEALERFAKRLGLFGCIFIILTGCGSGSGNETLAPISSSDPSAPPSLPATGIATLNWQANSDPDINGYRVYFGSSSGNYVQDAGQGINVGNVQVHEVNDLNSGQRYYFAITAYDAAGNESGYSNEVFKDIP